MTPKVNITGYIAENSLVYIMKAVYPDKTEYTAYTTEKKLKKAIAKCVAQVEDYTINYKKIGSVTTELMQMIPMIE